MSNEVCDGCGRTGWVLDGDYTSDPLCLELIPCVMPECAWSGRPLALLALPVGFRSTLHPSTGETMSVVRCT